MNKYSYFLTVWLLGLLLAQPSWAQYASTPPVRDGSISDAEYNNTFTNGTNTNKFKTGSGGTWYMTWDADYLYVAKQDGKTDEPNIMYLDLNPQLPVTGGSLAQGNLTGNRDFDVIPNLPFRGDIRVYFTNNYVEIRRATSDGQGNETWSAAITTGLDISNTGTNRELRLSWNTLTNNNGIPPSFNWLGYAINNAGGVSNVRYDLAPDNPSVAGVNGGATPPVEYYYTVISTANGSATKPFSLKSYTFPRNTSTNNFGSIEVWDFTMNSPGQSISRGTTGGTWAISGSLVVSSGIVYFGSGGTSYGDTFVGNIRMLGNGVLNMDQTTKPLNVREDVVLTGGSQLQLAGGLGGDLNVGRDFLVTDGQTNPATFQPVGRNVSFIGGSVAHRIRSNNAYLVPFSFLTMATSSGTVTLDTDISIGTSLVFGQGQLYTGSHFVELAPAASFNNESLASHLIGNARITKILDPITPVSTTDFGSLGFRIIPQNGTNAVGSVTLTRVTGTSISGVGATGSIERYFRLLTSGTSFPNPDFLVEFTYRLDELRGIPENTLAMYQALSNASGPYTQLTAPGSANTSAHTVSYNYRTALANDTYLTLASPRPLPVTLVSFKAQATAQGAALLSWNTANETNSKGFGIERQLGDGAWQSVGYVASTNLANGSAYEFTDKSLAAAPTSSRAYYRLRQEDFDGTLSYSPVAVIGRSAAEATQLVLSPVPVSGASLSVAFAEANLAGSEVTVSNTQGQRMLHLTTQASTDEALSLPVDKLTPGVYIVRVQVPGQTARYARFVKQ